ncbi:MAG: hypothetical protein AB1847_06640 [bacterium]
MMSIHILTIGGAGFINSRLADELLQDDNRIHALDNWPECRYLAEVAEEWLWTRNSQERGADTEAQAGLFNRFGG